VRRVEALEAAGMEGQIEFGAETFALGLVGGKAFRGVARVAETAAEGGGAAADVEDGLRALGDILEQKVLVTLLGDFETFQGEGGIRFPKPVMQVLEAEDLVVEAE